jgi:two-component system sensor histidine kinase UhpB
MKTDESEHHPAEKSAFALTIKYLVFAAIWIVASDYILSLFAQNTSIMTYLQTIKGWLFVSVTAVLLYYLVKRELEKRSRIIRELKISEAKLRALASHLQKIREEERSAIAREIHDELAQILTSIKINMNVLHKQLSNRTQDIESGYLEEELSSMSDLVDKTVKKMKRLIKDLRPDILENLGLIPAIEWLVNEFKTRSGMICTFTKNLNSITFDKNSSLALYRITQEALSNAARHSSASEVKVNLKRDTSHIKLEITDNGSGIKTDDLNKSSSFGIIGMNERAIILGGEFKIENIPEGGTRVSISIPDKAVMEA